MKEKTEDEEEEEEERQRSLPLYWLVCAAQEGGPLARVLVIPFPLWKRIEAHPSPPAGAIPRPEPTTFGLARVLSAQIKDRRRRAASRSRKKKEKRKKSYDD